MITNINNNKKIQLTSAYGSTFISKVPSLNVDLDRTNQCGWFLLRDKLCPSGGRTPAVEQVLVQSPTTLMPAERTSCYHMHNSQESF